MLPRLLACAILIASHAAFAKPRALLADSDEQLRAAISDALRPWAIEVSLSSAVPTTLDAAVTVAETTSVEYVIWREQGELVVLERGSRHVERRALVGGALDAVTAAAAALSVKTMLRLAPLLPTPSAGPGAAPGAGLRLAPDGATDASWLRLDVLAGVRFEEGLDSNLALRFGATLELKPWHALPLWFGVMGDGGASATVDQAGFAGRWSNWSILAHASWALRTGAWELAPWLAIGAEHSSLSGTELMTPRHRATFAPALRAGATLRYRVATWFVGGQLALEGLLSTPTYKTLAGTAPVFELPPIGAVMSVLVGTDFGP